MKLPNADTDSVISLQFQFTLQKNSTFILSKADIRNPLRYLLITECCFAAYSVKFSIKNFVRKVKRTFAIRFHI